MDKNTASLKKALKEGKVSISNNGLLYLEAYNSKWKNWTLQGSTMPICSGGPTVSLKATYNVNHACKLYLIQGLIGTNDEYNQNFDVSGSGTKTVSFPVENNIYLRAECISSNGNWRIYTNPILEVGL